MSLVTLINLSHSFSGKGLFKELSFRLEPGDRVGVIGPNGAGKTTLFKIIGGELSPDGGEVRINRDVRLGYLTQDVHETLTGPLLPSVVDCIPGRSDLKTEKNRIEMQLSQKDSPSSGKDDRVNRLSAVHQALIDLDQHYPPHEAERILGGLGFVEKDFNHPAETLSGGWKMRAALATLLYQNPDLLLLDEPTNHLDLPSVRWLEKYLQEFRGAILLVCHDRFFMNRHVDRILSFEPEGIRTYQGNFDFYLKAREEEKKALESRARNQAQRVKEAKKFIQRFQYKASKARQAQSKIKVLKKMALVKTHKTVKNIHFSFPQVPRSGRDVLRLEGVSKAFGDNALYESVHLIITRGEQVAIVGPNGAGKTTLLRLIGNELPPDEGGIKLGHAVRMSYYAQHHSEMLNPEMTILEAVYQAVPHETIGFVRSLCGTFLFSGTDVEKKVGILSGGERARVALAKILASPGNFLVMDEPTNHLDLLSSEILIDALKEFTGTLLFVSHNQSFVSQLATRIWDINEGNLFDYPGTLSEYEDHLARAEGEGVPSTSPPLPRDEKDKPTKHIDKKMMRKQKAEERRRIQETLKPIEKKVHDIENRLHRMEAKKKELEVRLADPETFRDKKTSLPLLNEYGDVKRKVDELFARWEYQQDQLSSARKTLGMEE
jgi:ATP-binding cassette subfamily F protein 3